ncbi:MAG: flagellar protein FliT [Gammaproteobacteria bacterium]|jgi:hypothetical protein|nr:flagellar protein FliT [Gammaproteobacteria bacterium]
MTVDAAQAVLECSERMLAAANAGRWDDLTRLERERRALLEYLFAPGAVVDAGALARLGRINDEIVTLGESHRDELRRTLEDGRSRRRAAEAYRAGAG